MAPTSSENELLIPIWQRAVIVFLVALIWMTLAPLPAVSERFHLMLPLLYFIAFWVRNRRPNGRILAYGAGIGLGILFYLLGNAQAQQIGSRFTLGEAFYSLYFTAGLFVIYGALCALLAAPLRWNTRAAALLDAPRGWWLRLLRMAVALLIFAPYLYTAFNIHRFKYATTTTPQAHGLAYENVAFRSEDGTPLRGWFIPARGSDQSVLLVHGIGSNRGDLLGVASFLQGAGYNVFVFDLRGHGDSGGHTISFGVHEAHDVSAALDYLKTRPDARRVAVYAFSMGGSAVLHAAGAKKLPAVQALVLDSTFAEFEPLARAQLTFLPAYAARPLLTMISFYTWLEIGASLQGIAPRRFIGHIAPRPLLLVHGTADTLIAPLQAQWNFDAAQAPKQLYLVPNANHCQGWAVARDAYEKRLVDFLNGALGVSAAP